MGTGGSGVAVDRSRSAHAMTAPPEPYLCSGCAVRSPWEHRCCGDETGHQCECPICKIAPTEAHALIGKAGPAMTNPSTEASAKADQGAIDLGALKQRLWGQQDGGDVSNLIAARDVAALIAAVEALRERVAELETQLTSYQTVGGAAGSLMSAQLQRIAELERAVGDAVQLENEQIRLRALAEIHATELTGALKVCEREMSEAYRLGLVDSLAPKSEASSFTQAVSVARTVLAATPAKALVRARTKDEVIHWVRGLAKGGDIPSQQVLATLDALDRHAQEDGT